MRGSPGELPSARLAVTVLWVLLFLAGLCSAAPAPTGDASSDTRKRVQGLLLDVALAGGRPVAVGSRGRVLIFDEDGSWVEGETPVSTMLTAVFFSDADHGWAVGHDAVILRTQDGGMHWEQVYSDPQQQAPLLDVWVGDGQNGIAIGAYSMFLVTRDGGRTWEPRTFDAAPAADESDGEGEKAIDDFSDEYDFHLNAIRQAPGGALYIAAEGGNVYRSEDAGNSWAQLASPYQGSFYGALPLDGGTLLVLGLRGHLYRSDDNGRSWTQVETGTKEMLTDAVRLRDGRIVIVGLGGVVLHGDQEGLRFTLVRRPDRAGLSAVLEGPSGQVIAVGEGGFRVLSP